MRRGGPSTLTPVQPVRRASSATNSVISRVSPASVRVVAPSIGRVTAAAVYLPARDVIYAASVDAPATRNGEPVAPSDMDIDGARVLTSRAALDPAMWRADAPPPFRREFRPSIAWRLSQP